MNSNKINDCDNKDIPHNVLDETNNKTVNETVNETVDKTVNETANETVDKPDKSDNIPDDKNLEITKTKQNVIQDKDFYNFLCPHCLIGVEVKKKELNCKIFRCGVYKSNNKQINPHAKKELCDKLKKEDLIYGCGKPFMFKGTYVEICDYI